MKKFNNLQAVPDEIPEILISFLTFLANQDDMLSQLIDSTGIDGNELVQSIKRPHIQAALLDFLLDEDERMRQFCQSHQINPEDVWRLRQALPGGNVPHWT